MLAMRDVTEMQSAAMKAQVSAEAAADELDHAVDSVEQLHGDDEDVVEQLHELQDSLQTAASALEDALRDVNSVL
jgi:predicted  nucleic acid-binding Zn-ribbon protein